MYFFYTFQNIHRIEKKFQMRVADLNELYITLCSTKLSPYLKQNTRRLQDND
jgi:hypothetical protein